MSELLLGTMSSVSKRRRRALEDISNSKRRRASTPDAETPTKTASEHELDATPSASQYVLSWLKDGNNIQEASTSNLSKPKVYSHCKKPQEEVITMSCPQIGRSQRASLKRGDKFGAYKYCPKNEPDDSCLQGCSSLGKETLSKAQLGSKRSFPLKTSTKKRGLPESFVADQKNQFAKVDAFKLEEEEAASESE